MGNAIAFPDDFPVVGPRPIDPAPGFRALKTNPALLTLGITLEIGRAKNINKNPVAEKAVAEVEEELRRQAPNGEPITQLGLSIAISRLNSRLRRQGLSAYELWTHRDQYSNTQLPIDDTNTIRTQHQQRLKNHPHSERSKYPKETRVHTSIHKIAVGDLVYLRAEQIKQKSATDTWWYQLTAHGALSRSLLLHRFEQSLIKSALTNVIVFPVK